jgi:hypothetical protein
MAQRCIAEFKPIQLEMNKSENNYLIHSNPLISNKKLVNNEFSEV